MDQTKKPIRFTKEKQQELISRYQLCERLVEFGWIPNLPADDLGEDITVNIYFEMQATGASFYIQEKSITNLAKRQKGDFLPYSFEVKDLKHWETFVQPIVLLIWDVKLREGRWTIWNGDHGAIEYTNKKRPDWRNQKKTLVYIPIENRTNDDGLQKLRYDIGKYMFSIASKNKQLDMQLVINPLNINDAKRASESFEKFYNNGDAITFTKNDIQSVDIPDWAKPWLDTNFIEITIGIMESSKPLLVDVNIISTNGETATMRGIELKIIKSGMQTTLLSNKHQISPLIFEFDISTSTNCKAGISINNLSGSVNMVSDTIKFLQALSVGGVLQLFSLEKNSPIPIAISIPLCPKWHLIQNL